MCMYMPQLEKLIEKTPVGTETLSKSMEVKSLGASNGFLVKRLPLLQIHVDPPWPFSKTSLVLPLGLCPLCDPNERLFPAARVNTLGLPNLRVSQPRS